MRQTEEIPCVYNVMHPAIICTEDEEIQAIAKRIVTKSVNHIVVVDETGKLKGIVTSWGISHGPWLKAKSISRLRIPQRSHCKT